jgi:hypothetical protein
MKTLIDRLADVYQRNPKGRHTPGCPGCEEMQAAASCRDLLDPERVLKPHVAECSIGELLHLMAELDR